MFKRVYIVVYCVVCFKVTAALRSFTCKVEELFVQPRTDDVFSSLKIELVK